MFEERLSFLEFALGKLTEAVEEMLVGMEERKKGEIDVDGVKQGKNIYCIHRCTRFESVCIYDCIIVLISNRTYN